MYWASPPAYVRFTSLLTILILLLFSVLSGLSTGDSEDLLLSEVVFPENSSTRDFRCDFSCLVRSDFYTLPQSFSCRKDSFRLNPRPTSPHCPLLQLFVIRLLIDIYCRKSFDSSSLIPSFEHPSFLQSFI